LVRRGIVVPNANLCASGFGGMEEIVGHLAMV